MADEEGSNLASPSKDKIIMTCAIIGLGMICAFIIIATLAIVGYLTGNNYGGQIKQEASQVDCSGVATLTLEQYQWVKDSSGKYLGGDEAALIALIQIESGWRVDAVNGNAVGLGQFMPGTAKGFPEFVGGDDKHGITWPPGTVYDSNPQSDDARFDAKRSIYGAAHLLGGMISKYGSLGEAYEKGYHGGNTAAQIAEAKKGRERLEQEYATLIDGGGCKVVGGIPCGVVPVSSENANLNAKHPLLMPPATDDFNRLAAEYRAKTGKKISVTSMFRTQAEQEALYREKPGLANPPGTSMHEAGLAIDFNIEEMSDGEYETLKQISGNYNWQVNTGSGGVKGAAESWHFDYIGLKDQYWYGEPKITNAIQAANRSDCDSQTGG